jgi:hypothetical protein
VGPLLCTAIGLSISRGGAARRQPSMAAIRPTEQVDELARGRVAVIAVSACAPPPPKRRPSPLPR